MPTPAVQTRLGNRYLISSPLSSASPMIEVRG
jgi:hypothetical protein